MAIKFVLFSDGNEREIGNLSYQFPLQISRLNQSYGLFCEWIVIKTDDRNQYLFLVAELLFTGSL